MKISKTNNIKSKIATISVWTAALITVGMLVAIILYVVIKGISNLSLDMFALNYSSENLSLMPALINTLIMTVLCLLTAVPLGVFSAVYLVEYAKRGSKIVSLIRLTTETLQGIPSIVFGLFGYLFLVSFLDWSYCMLAGVLTLSIMILPVIIRTSEEALKSVPDIYREGSFGLGAGKLKTEFKIVIPAAMPGILSGIVLAMGRIVGESAALIYTAGSAAQVPLSLMGPGRTLAIHIYALWSEGLNTEKAYATALILLVIVFGLNYLSSYVAKKMMKGKTDG